MTDEILATLIEAIAVYKEKIADLEDTIDLIKDETKTNQDEVVNVKEALEKQIEDMAIATNKLIDKAIKSIKIPEAEKVDYYRIETSIKAKINRLLHEKDADIAEVRADLKRYVIENLARFKPRDGKDADNELIIRELKDFIQTNKSQFKGKDGRDGESGVDGVGIADIKKDKDYLTIYLTDGTKKRFEIPKTTIYRGNGQGISEAEKEQIEKNKTAIQAIDEAAVKVSGDQTIQGDKTFEESPSVPIPTNENDAVNKGYVDELDKNNSKFLSNSITVTVGESGKDFETVNEALENLSKFYPLYKKGGFSATILIEDGYILKEQLLFDGIDLSFITISYEGSGYLLVDRDYLTTNFDGRYPVFGARNGANSPILNLVFDCQVELGSDVAADTKDGIYVSSASMTCVGTSGAVNCSGIGIFISVGALNTNTLIGSSNKNVGIYAKNGGQISANTVTASSDTLYALYSYSGSVQSNSITVNSRANIGVYARSGGAISAETINASSDLSTGLQIINSSVQAITINASSQGGVGVYISSGTLSVSYLGSSSVSNYGIQMYGGMVSAYTSTISSSSSIALYANAGAVFSSEGLTASSDTYIGIYAREATISAYNGTISSQTSISAASRGGTISIENMELSNSEDSSNYLAIVLGGGIIRSTTGTWTNNGSGNKCNVSAGTISSNGYVNRIG